MENTKYSDLFAETLVGLGYSHCFFVAGGNIMHLIESLSRRMKMVPVVNEIATVIAAEYFNEVSRSEGEKALALVTAGPGITNAITGIAGAFAESREVLVVGGQVKSADLSRGVLRQRGIQEVDGIAITSPLCLRTLQIEKPIAQRELIDFLHQPTDSRKGPLFIEFCLDAQNHQVGPDFRNGNPPGTIGISHPAKAFEIREVVDLLETARRPVLLLGSGVALEYITPLLEITTEMGLPVLTSWNAADRVSCDRENYFGRPNNWGQRHSNLIIQQADVVIAAGTRLGYQQTGFNFEQFAPSAKIVQIDVDSAEITKGHPEIDVGIVADAADALSRIFETRPVSRLKITGWLDLCAEITRRVPVPDPENFGRPEYIEIFQFLHTLSNHFGPNDVIIPCSSGGGSTVTMQVVKQKGLPQRIVTNKGMASMGYGLPGAIGSCFARPGQTTWLVDGDGGFIQNSQELGVIGQFQLPLKIFLISNNGYASIRSTQRNYFEGHYVGCDPSTGLNLPDWEGLTRAYGVGYFRIDPLNPFSDAFLEVLKNPAPCLFEIPVDPEQTFYPKIQSRVSATKGMESNPLHEMTPLLDRELIKELTPHLEITM
jgi:acetolactate synthase-1/2/3 large subunit